MWILRQLWSFKSDLQSSCNQSAVKLVVVELDIIDIEATESQGDPVKHVADGNSNKQNDENKETYKPEHNKKSEKVSKDYFNCGYQIWS